MGENVGAATCVSIVYAALATVLAAEPDAMAMALMVSEFMTEMAPEYNCVEPPAVVAGVVPSRV
jgi:hypothetical protein